MALALCLGLFAAVADAGETGAGQNIRPHMMYFHNPSCRMCTRTNQVVGEAETKYKDSLSQQRFNIADAESGLDNVEYMFELLDVMDQPPKITPTLVVFLGILETEKGELIFTPKRILVEGEEITEKLDAEIVDFLSKEGKGEKSLGLARQASFFFHDRLGVDSGS